MEAMEVIELYCDLLLARFGMLEQMMYCEDSLAESVATLIWVAPRLSADVQELNQVVSFNAFQSCTCTLIQAYVVGTWSIYMYVVTM